MINHVYQLVAPRTITVTYKDVPVQPDRVLIRPRAMAICHADCRYYWGKRDPETLRKKLPMALIHECCGEVLFDPTGTFKRGEQVSLIPNVPGEYGGEFYENYGKGSGFLSSGRDGFMREIVSLAPDRVVSCEGIEPTLAAIAEFVSVTEHAVDRLLALGHSRRQRIAVIGDGSMGFAVACTLKYRLPDAELVIIGHNREKLGLFSFAKERYLSSDVPADLEFDHAFECAGGNGCESAIRFVIDHIRPQGALMLMGVSELDVPIYTRNVLEKGMTLIGCSRSGRENFEMAIDMMRDPAVQRRLSQIVFVDEPVHNIADIKRAFSTDMETPFKTVFRWEV